MGAPVLDVRKLVDERDAVEAGLRRRGFAFSADGDPWSLDAQRRTVIGEVEQLRHDQRKAGEEIARRGRSKEDATDLKAEMKAVSERIHALEAQLEDAEARLRDVLLQAPNLPDPGVPDGRDESAAVEVRRVGEPPALAFTAKAHWELGPELGILDFERAAKISGARFAVSWGAGARDRKSTV